MNKKIFSYMSVAAVMAAGLSGCSEEQTIPVGEGTVFLSTRVNSDVVVESRAEAEEELAESTIVWIYSDEGVVRKYNGMASIPTSGLKLISGDYTIKAWAGKLEYASFESRWFAGQEQVTLEPNSAKAVEVVCKIANVVASVKYPENVDELISDYSLTVSHKGGSLTFEGLDERKGYYMMPEGVTSLDYVLTFTASGEQKTVRGLIDNVQPAHEYVFNVIAKTAEEDNDGAAFIEIEIDDTTIDVNDEIVITTPPAISGYGFDISAPVAGESGTIGRKSVYVCAASELQSVKLEGIPMVEGFEAIDFIRATPEALATLRNAGIFHEVENAHNGQMIKIVFEDTFVNALPNSEEPYVINISATDKGDKTSSAALTLRVTEAPVVSAPIPAEQAECYFTQTLSATVAKDGVDAVGFEVATVDSDDWTYVAGSTSRAFTKGQTYYATLTDLVPGTRYKYRAVAGTAAEITYRAEEQTFETGVLNQLPNAGFEQWHTGGLTGNALVPMASAGEEGWDTGNHGSTTMGDNITTYVESPKHSGLYATKLRSQFVGIGSLGKFAAGNIFYGKYIKTAGTNGIIGFGRPFDFPARELKPVAVKMWVKYEPTNEWKGKTDHKPASGYDEGHIFIALFDGPDNGDSEASYRGKYGYVVRTANASRLFDKNATNVMAYGEKVFTEATPGDGMVELTIPFEYYAAKAGNQPTHIAVVCTASKYGDFFQGGEGSTMYVDDVEIVYGAR